MRGTATKHKPMRRGEIVAMNPSVKQMVMLERRKMLRLYVTCTTHVSG
jgi:hypothetical protein